MGNFDSTSTPNVYRLHQQRGPVPQATLRRPTTAWPLTLNDCEAALIRLLPEVKLDRRIAPTYWKWVARTRAEMARIYESHRQECRARQEWDLTGLLRLRCRVELVTLRLFCAPWLPGASRLPSLGLARFNRSIG